MIYYSKRVRQLSLSLIEWYPRTVRHRAFLIDVDKIIDNRSANQRALRGQPLS